MYYNYVQNRVGNYKFVTKNLYDLFAHLDLNGNER